jgi:hypothetical protein
MMYENYCLQDKDEWDEVFIPDEEFQKNLTDQEKTIFNALIISLT